MESTRPRLYCQSGVLAQAQLYADECHIEVTESAPKKPIEPSLWWDASGLALLLPGRRQPFRLSQDRLRARLGASTGLVRACGLLGGTHELRILDVFAGFCIDSLTMGCAGAQVTAIESHPLVYCLAQDFLSKFSENVTLHLGDGVGRLEQIKNDSTLQSEPWDVVYLDPMFVPRSKAALPGLPAQILRSLNAGVEQSIDQAEQYVELGQAVAHKVVFKRPLKDAAVGQPNHTFKGRSVRFDVYV